MSFNGRATSIAPSSPPSSVPYALAADGLKIGNQAGERALEEVLVEEGGFTRLRRVFDTPLSMVLEARP
jgi:hypothetical protein